MKKLLTKAISHREFLKACGLAVLGAGTGQVVVPPKVVSAYTFNENLTVNGSLTVNANSVTNYDPACFYLYGGWGIGIPTSGSQTNGQISAYGHYWNSNWTVDGYVNTHVIALLSDAAGDGRSINSRIEFRLAQDYSGSLGEVARITGVGNVGIGTTSPRAKLEINGGTSADHIWFNSPSQNYRIGIGASNEFYIDNGLGEKNDLVIGASGNVGIGTTTPTSKLQVVGDIQVTSGILKGTAQKSYYDQ